MTFVTTWFLIFLVYSFLGWVMEVTVSIVERQKVVNRGFLIGPICPIYGCGALLITLLLDGSNESPLVTFCVSMVGGTTLEYVVSVIMEKLFHVRWWDYSSNAFNLNGRICLRSTIAFGVLGVLMTYFLTPGLLSLVEQIPPLARTISAGLLFLALLIDIGTSLWLIANFKVTVEAVQKDATEEITERVREILGDRGSLSRRLLKAFPNFSPKQRPPATHEPKKPKTNHKKSQT